MKAHPAEPPPHPLTRFAVATCAAGVVTAALSSGCAVGPNYHRPSAPVPQQYKEAAGWKPAEPREAASGAPWWSVYDDATLDELEKQIDISNQTLKASEAQWREAVALVAQTRAGLFPTVGVSGTGLRSGGPGGKSATSSASTGGVAASVSSHQIGRASCRERVLRLV